uniref:Uncharacterized protein n=1 Tax=Felis catus TaxID=9685 RepID=A0ABI8AQT6_FELCA
MATAGLKYLAQLD